MKHLQVRTLVWPLYDVLCIKTPYNCQHINVWIVDSYIWASTEHADGSDHIEASDSRLLGDFTIAGNTHTSIL